MLSEAINDVPYIADPVQVGSGGFATVHRATDRQADRPVAVKLLSLRSDDGNLKHFDRERESLARLSTHPNVVTLHRTGITTGGVPYLIMEYASGGTLSDRLQADGAMPWPDAVGLILPICRAVQHAHQQGIRHRDIKPQNILISAHGEPLLSDFGIAGLAAGTETVTEQARLSLSHASPEQIEGRKVGDSTDVYSLGATLYTLIAGAPAFADSGQGFLHTAKRILEARPAPLGDRVPADIADAIAAAMAKDPANRPTIDEFRRALGREIRLGAPPADDALPPVSAGSASAPGLGQREPDDTLVMDRAPGPRLDPSGVGLGAGIGAGAHVGEADEPVSLLSRLSDGPGRIVSLVAVAAMVLAAFVAVAWASRGDSTDPDGEGVAAEAGEQAGSDTDADDQDGPTSGSTTVAPDQGEDEEVDGDGDGIADATDNCAEVANPGQEDDDGDAVGNACDPDDDDDGVPDEGDNCPLDANTDQADVDADGLGDACDDFPDRDEDGVIDTDDPCIEPADAPDTDGDGIPDACDETPRGMTVVAASVQIDQLAISNEAYGDGEADMFGDLTVAGTKFDLPEIEDRREIRPGNWVSDRVTIDPGVPLIRIRIWIRDEDDCLFCRDGLVDITPEPGQNALHLVVDTETGTVDRATESWNRIETVGRLGGPADGDLSGSIQQQGDNGEVHLGTIDLSITLVREPVS